MYVNILALSSFTYFPQAGVLLQKAIFGQFDGSVSQVRRVKVNPVRNPALLFALLGGNPDFTSLVFQT